VLTFLKITTGAAGLKKRTVPVRMHEGNLGQAAFELLFFKFDIRIFIWQLPD
jgi:hypothetical protein